MKKTIISSLICSVFLLVACSKNDDDNSDDKDVVFAAPYIPLESFQDLEPGNGWFNYQGAKIGDRSYGAISNSNCLAQNTIYFVGNDLMRKDSIVYNSFHSVEASNKNCSLDFRRTMRKVKMASKGYMFVDIYDYTLKPVDTIKATNVIVYDTIKTTYFKGNLEIGFQKDMLRIEDKFTRYSGKEKVYLYFKNAK